MINEEDIKNFENKNLLDSTVLELEWVLTKTASISGLNNIQKTQNKNYRIAIYCLNKQRKEKDKEIERLNNKLNTIRKYLKDNEQEYGSLEDNEKIILSILNGDSNE